MTSRSSWLSPKLIMDTFKKNLWLFSLAFLAFFFSLPVATAIRLQNLDANQAQYAPDNLLLLKAAKVLYPFNGANPFVIFFMILGAVVTACAVFYYLHNKKRVDFYHSLPLTRTKLFFTNYLTGFLLIALPYFICLIFTLLVIAAKGYLGYLAWGAALAGVAQHLLFFLAIYSLAAVAATLTGNLVIHFLLTGVFLGIGPAFVGTYLGAMETFYDTFYNWGATTKYWFAYSSPAARYIYNAEGSIPVTGLDYILLAVFILIVTVLALALYRKRPSEGAGHAVTFRYAKPLIKYPLIFLATMLCGLFFYSFNHNDWGWLFFGFVCGAFIVSRIIEIILVFDFKAIGKNFKGLLIFAVLFAAFITVPLFDLTHYDSYLPDNADVIKVNLFIDNMDGFNTDNSDILRFLESNGNNNRNYSNYEERQAYTSLLQDSANVAAAVEMANIAVSRSETAASDRTGNGTRLAIVYTMANGRQVARQYDWVANKDLMTAASTILNSKEYKERHYSILQAPPENIELNSIEFFESGADESISTHTIPVSKSLLLAQALQKDVQNMTASDMAEQMPIALLDFTLYQESIADINQKSTEDLKQIGSTQFSCPIYPTFSKTLSVLQELGYGSDSFRLDLSKIDSIQLINEDSDEAYEKTVATYDGSFYSERSTTAAPQAIGETITDPAKIKAALAQAYPNRAYDYNRFHQADYRTAIQVLYDQNGYSTSVTWRKLLTE